MTAGEALALMALGLALGLAAGRLLRSRLALLAPLAYMAGFESATGGRASARPWTGSASAPPGGSSPWSSAAGSTGSSRSCRCCLGRRSAPLSPGGTPRPCRAAAPPASGSPRGAFVIVTVAAGLGTLAVLIALPASTPSVRAADGSVVSGGIAELRQVTLGGVDQWVEIRARSADDPVLLYLPGGPGQSDLGLGRALLRDLEQHLVVVIWDGRGSASGSRPSTPA